MSLQDHPLRIHLVAPTGTRNWSGAAFTCATALWFAASASRTEAALAAINVFLWSVNFFYVLLYANVLPLIFATRPVRPSRDNFCGELRPRRRRRLSARLMRITSGEPVPTERLATYDDTRQIFAD